MEQIELIVQIDVFIDGIEYVVVMVDWVEVVCFVDVCWLFVVLFLIDQLFVGIVVICCMQVSNDWIFVDV